MNPSDWISIVAICTSLVIALGGFVFNYMTNKENLKARRIDIVTENSIEAFRELVEKLNLFILERTLDEQGDKLGIRVELPHGAVDDLFHTYSKYGLYYPSTIGQDILSLANSFSRKSEFKDNNVALPKARELIDRIQKHLGVETEEKRAKK